MSKTHPRKILLLEDDHLFARSIRKNLEDYYSVAHATRIDEALDLIAKDPPDLVLLDMMLQGENGLDFLGRIKDRMDHISVVALTAVDRIETVVRAMRAGAVDYLTKPVTCDALLLAIEHALENNELIKEIQGRRSLQVESNRRNHVLGSSASMEKTREDIGIIGPTDATVLIRGETGTGKEVVARSIHASSSRADGPFVAVNCGAIPRDLFEAEFFGYKKGAFTGAEDNTRGKFQLAHRGTLLLDEVGELPPEAQVKLLRVLEEQEFYPVGSGELIRVDTRVIASTHRDLATMVEEGNFREDLFYRLNVFEIHISPLRDRPEDTLLLARYFAEQFAKKFRQTPCALSDSADAALAKFLWKGNVRELRNLMERLALTHPGKSITAKHLSPLLIDRSRADAPAVFPGSGEFQLPVEGIDLDQVEKRLMQQALERTDGNKSQAARLLNLSPATFYYRMDKYDL